MKILINHELEPSFNLALEEYLLKRCEDEFFVLWRNRKSIIVGRNQNTYAEINTDYVRKKNIAVVRRMTGGGTVFHDTGNLNFTFIYRNAAHLFDRYDLLSAPIVQALRALSIPAELSGRNDLLAHGKKCSGNAQCMSGSSLLYHGTLLVSADVSTMSEALRVNPLKVQSKGIKSVHSRVTNLREYLPRDFTTTDLADYIANFVSRLQNHAEYITLTEQQVAEIRQLAREKYETWEWNYGFRRPYTHTAEEKFACGILQANLSVEQDRIAEARFYGDYFGKRDVTELEQSLVGVPYRADALMRVLATLPIAEYFSGLTAQDLLRVLL